MIIISNLGINLNIMNNESRSSKLVNALNSWLKYIARRKIKTENRRILYNTVKKIDGQILENGAFLLWMIYTKDCQEYMNDVRAILIENAIRRILNSWRNYTQQKKIKHNVNNQMIQFVDKSKSLKLFKK